MPKKNRKYLDGFPVSQRIGPKVPGLTCSGESKPMITRAKNAFYGLVSDFGLDRNDVICAFEWACEKHPNHINSRERAIGRLLAIENGENAPSYQAGQALINWSDHCADCANTDPTADPSKTCVPVLNHRVDTLGCSVSSDNTQDSGSNLDNEVTRPNYYGGEKDPFEPIKIIEAWGLNFHLGCVVKYIRRHNQKGGVKDLKKAQWYLNRWIEKVEGSKEINVSVTWESECSTPVIDFLPSV